MSYREVQNIKTLCERWFILSEYSTLPTQLHSGEWLLWGYLKCIYTKIDFEGK